MVEIHAKWDHWSLSLEIDIAITITAALRLLSGRWQTSGKGGKSEESVRVCVCVRDMSYLVIFFFLSTAS